MLLLESQAADSRASRACESAAPTCTADAGRRALARSIGAYAFHFGELARTCALAGVLFLAYYGLLFTIYYILHVDYRFLFMGVRVFQPEMVVMLGMYAPFFLPFFLSNSLRVKA